MEDFGGLVRRRREELGLSQARVAELVGRAPGTVRAWERGHSVPADTAVLRSLAAVLAIDEGELLACAGVHPPEERARPTVDEALASLADVLPGPVADEKPVSGGDSLVPSDLGPGEGSEGWGEGSEGWGGGSEGWGGGSEGWGGGSEGWGEGREGWGEGREGWGEGREGWGEGREGWGEGSEEMVSTGRAAVPGDVPRVAPAYPGSYLDDPEEKAIYRQRALRTAVGVAVSALVGFLALRGLGIAIEAVWDVIAASW